MHCRPLAPRATLAACLIAVATLVAPALAQDSRAARPVTLDDLALLVRVADPQISPDGKTVVVVVSRTNPDENRFDSELVSIEIASGAQRVLTHDRRHVASPRWSPSGDRLAFLADAAPRPAKKGAAGEKPASGPSGSGDGPAPQIFVMPMQGGDALQVTDAADGVQQFSWRPDGTALAYVTEDDPPDRDARKKGQDEFEVGNNDFLATAAPRPAHLWLASADGHEQRRLTSGSWSLPESAPPGPPASPPSWSPDGKTIAFVRQEHPHSGDSDQTRAQILDVASGAIRTLTARQTLESMPAFSPDGSQITLWYPRGGDLNQVNEVSVVPTAGGEPRVLTTAIDRCVYQSRWMPDGRAILTGGNDGTRVSLWIQPLAGNARRLDLGDVNPSWSFWIDANVGPAGAIAFTGSEPHRPTELYYLASPDAAPRRLTSFNDAVAGRLLGAVEHIEWKSADGFTEDGVLTFPPDFVASRHYPLVLLIHGGPGAASTTSFSPVTQAFAARGWVVFQPNYRGSDNRGNAYQLAIVGDAGEGPGRDVIAGIEAVKSRGFVDPARIAVSGWSYGGYMTSWLIGHYDFWKAAVSGASVTSFVEQYDLADFNQQQRYSFGGRSPYVGDAAKDYLAQSPITWLGRAKTPTLVLSNTGDARVPVTQSYRLYHALKDNGVETKFIAFPVAGHFPGDPARMRSVYRHWMTWLADRLSPADGGSPPAMK